MDTKLHGDIAEQAAILEILKRGWGVMVPIGDRLPYDLVIDLEGQLKKIQVKSAWWDEKKQNYVVDNRRTQTNRRVMKRSSYLPGDFDFALLYIRELSIFYIMPFEIFNGYGSEIHLVEAEKRQRKPKSVDYREAWNLLEA